jgi:hypothetical protein
MTTPSLELTKDDAAEFLRKTGHSDWMNQTEKRLEGIPIYDNRTLTILSIFHREKPEPVLAVITLSKSDPPFITDGWRVLFFHGVEAKSPEEAAIVELITQMAGGSVFHERD